jgi:hypothetical protein
VITTSRGSRGRGVGVYWFIREPSGERYGRVAVRGDLYGNLWDLIQYKYTRELIPGHSKF